MPSSSTEINPLLDQIAQLGQAGRLDEAIALCQQVLRQHPQTARAHHLLGLAILQQGRSQEALTHLEQAIALDPTGAEAYSHAGVVHFSLGNVERGILCYQQAVALQPDSTDSRYNLALGLQKLGRLEEAVREYQQIISQNPHHAPASQQLEKMLHQTVEAQQLRGATPGNRDGGAAPSALAPGLANEAIACQADDGFQSWLSQAGGSLAITTYQAGKVVLVGWNGQQVTVLLRQFAKPTGMAVQGDRLALATHHEVVLFANAPILAQDYLEANPRQYDALYLPRAAYFTGDLNIHDLAFGSEAIASTSTSAPILWLVNTRFSCLATLSQDFSFVPRWHPSFISALVPEDRCHLNGLAMVEGNPKYVTALGETDEVGGWRSTKATGGILIDVETQDVLLRNLSMPHSPGWHQGFLWFLNSGQGELWRVDPFTKQAEVVCTLPGFGRGLCFVEDYALVGLSQIRETDIFGDLPIQERFEQLLCGVAVVDLRTGETVGLLQFTGGCQELYGVQFLSDVFRPTLLNLDKPAAREAFTAPEFAYWLRPSALLNFSGQ